MRGTNMNAQRMVSQDRLAVDIALLVIRMVHGKNGFFLDKSGFEYNLALIGLLVPILLAGPGRFTIAQYLPLSKSARTGRPIIFLE
jgi:hypothetical protein